MLPESQLKKVIELDEVSGRFELDDDGYTRFFPSDKEKADIERYFAEEIDRVLRENRERWDAQAENRLSYSATKTVLPELGGKAVLPSPIACIPADQIIASTHNNIMRPQHLFALDPYYDSSYPVLMPSPEYDPNDPSSAAMANVPPGTPMRLDVKAEDISRRMESGINFVCRERLGFESLNHKVVDGCVIEGCAWLKTVREAKKRRIIKPKATSSLVNVEDTEELEYNSGSQIKWVFVHDSNMLRPNMDQDIDELEWLGERPPNTTPDDIREKYANGDYFLIKDEVEAEAIANSITATVDESKRRVDADVKKSAPEDPDKYCDVYEMWPYRWLHVKNEKTGESERRKFMLQCFYHHGARKLMAAFRNPYHHQRRIHRVANQFLDGSSTVSKVKYNQQVGTIAVQSEFKNAFIANNHQPWYDPTATDTAAFLAKGHPVSPETPIPGVYARDFGYATRGAAHSSMLPFMQWNSGIAQETSKVGDYETRGSAPSHTSPNVVSMLLDRGGQTSVLFLSMLNGFWRECARLYLETARQFQPLGEVIPVRDPRTRAVTMVPMRYPIGEALDNFRISLTAADEAASRERDPDQMASLMSTWQGHVSFMMEPIAALISPDTTEEQAKMFRKIIEGGQLLADRLIATTRVDEDSFNILPEVDSVIAEKSKLMAEARARAETEAANAAANQAPDGGGAVPTDGTGDMGGPPGAGAQPGVEGSPAPVPDSSMSAPVAG